MQFFYIMINPYVLISEVVVGIPILAFLFAFAYLEMLQFDPNLFYETTQPST